MGRSYKWLGGIGYILTFIPYVNLIAALLVAIAWIMMGRDTDQKLFTITGVLIIIVFAAVIGLVGVLVSMIPGLLTGIPYTPGRIPPFQYLKNILAFAGVLIALVLVVAAAGLAALIAEIASHFRAAKFFDNTWFKVGGWLRIATIIMIVIAISIIALTAVNMPQALSGLAPRMMAGNMFGILMGFLWPLIIVGILGLLATIFSIVAFFTIPEETI